MVLLGSGARGRPRRARKIQLRSRCTDALGADLIGSKPNVQRAQDDSGLGQDRGTNQTTNLASLPGCVLPLAEVAANIRERSANCQILCQSRITRRSKAAMRKSGRRQREANRRNAQGPENKLKGRNIHAV